MELHNEVAKFQNNVAGLKSKNAKLQDMNFAQEIDIKLFRAVSKEVSENLFFNKIQLRTDYPGTLIAYNHSKYPKKLCQ